MPPWLQMLGSHQIFAEVLARCVDESADPADRLARISQRAAAPLRVAVRGRRGVGVPTVRAALTAAGVDVVDDGADVEVLVVAEVAKPEDGTGRATLVVLNKADLSSPDAFLGGDHRLPLAAREHLLESLDLFGIARSVVTLRDAPGSADACEVRAALRRVSRIDEVIQRIDALAADARYRRLLEVADELQGLAITDGRIAEFLGADDTVLARMTAAVAVVEGVGLTVDPSDEPAAHLRRAVHWRRYGGGPVNDLHRACAADITRGSLRLLAASSCGGGAP